LSAKRFRTLTVYNADRALPGWLAGFPRPLIDLSRLERFDAYFMAILLSLGKYFS